MSNQTPGVAPVFWKASRGGRSTRFVAGDIGTHLRPSEACRCARGAGSLSSARWAGAGHGPQPMRSAAAPQQGRVAPALGPRTAPSDYKHRTPHQTEPSHLEARRRAPLELQALRSPSQALSADWATRRRSASTLSCWSAARLLSFARSSFWISGLQSRAASRARHRANLPSPRRESPGPRAAPAPRSPCRRS